MIHNQWIVFEYEWVIKWTPDVTKQQVTSPNNKSNHKKKNYLINYSCPSAWWEQWDHDVDIYLNNLCKNNKQFQVKYTYNKFYKLKLSTNIELLFFLLLLFFILAWTKLFNVEITLVFL